MKNRKLNAYVKRMTNLKGRVLPDNVLIHSHHIIPKFMGGTDLEDNKVLLTIEEHIDAHIELANCFPIGSEERNKNLCSANVTKVWIGKPCDIDVTGENNPMWRKKHSADTRSKIGQKSAMKEFSDEYRKKLSDASKGENNPMWGKKHSKKTRLKISNAVKGENHPWYGTSRPNIVKEKIGLSQPSRKIVHKCDINRNIIETYDSLGIAAKKNGISQGNLSGYLNGSRLTKKGKPKVLGGFVWKDEDIK